MSKVTLYFKSHSTKKKTVFLKKSQGIAKHSTKITSFLEEKKGIVFFSSFWQAQLLSIATVAGTYMFR